MDKPRGEDRRSGDHYLALELCVVLENIVLGRDRLELANVEYARTTAPGFVAKFADRIRRRIFQRAACRLGPRKRRDWKREIEGTMRVFAFRPYLPSVRRVYQPAALSE